MWVKKNGSKIRIKDLTDDHLLNIIRLLNAQDYEHRLYHAIYDEAISRGLRTEPKICGRIEEAEIIALGYDAEFWKD